MRCVRDSYQSRLDSAIVRRARAREERPSLWAPSFPSHPPLSPSPPFSPHQRPTLDGCADDLASVSLFVPQVQDHRECPLRWRGQGGANKLQRRPVVACALFGATARQGRLPSCLAALLILYSYLRLVWRTDSTAHILYRPATSSPRTSQSSRVSRLARLRTWLGKNATILWSRVAGRLLTFALRPSFVANYRVELRRIEYWTVGRASFGLKSCVFRPLTPHFSYSIRAPGHDSDVYLRPVTIFKDPFRGGDNILVLCETYNSDGSPNRVCRRVLNIAHVCSTARSSDSAVFAIIRPTTGIRPTRTWSLPRSMSPGSVSSRSTPSLTPTAGLLPGPRVVTPAPRDLTTVVLEPAASLPVTSSRLTTCVIIGSLPRASRIPGLILEIFRCFFTARLPLRRCRDRRYQR